MQVYYDLALGLFLQSPGSFNQITQITAKRASNNPIALQFLNNGVVTTAPTGTGFIFSAKQVFNSQGPNAYYDANFIVYAGNSSWSGPDSNSNYNVNPGYNTVPLNNLFGYTYPNIDNNPQVDAVYLVGEISWLVPGATYYNKTPYFLIKVYNDVSKGIEGVPTSGGPVYPDPSIIEITTHKGNPNGYAGLDANGFIPKSNIPPIIFNYSGVTQLTGGTANTCLDAIPTAAGSTPANLALSLFDVNYNSGSSTIGGASIWRYQAGSYAANPGSVVLPVDAPTAGAWVRKLSREFNAGAYTLPAGTNSFTVPITTGNVLPISNPPRIHASIIRKTGQLGLYPVAIYSVSGSAFSIDLNGNTDTGDYQCDWFAY